MVRTDQDTGYQAHNTLAGTRLSTPPFLDGDEIVSYSVVLKWPKKLLRLPLGADLSVFYNESDNFTPTGEGPTRLAIRCRPRRARPRKSGSNLSAFGGKLNIRLNRFETSIINQTIISGGLPTQIAETAITDTVAAWAREGNRNPGNVAFMNAAIAQMLSPLPADYMDRRSYRVSGAAPDITTTYDRPQSSDTTDFTAKGTEGSITYNPSRNWRMLANFAKAETIQSNLYPVTKAMLELMQPAFNATVRDPASGTTVRFGDIPKAGYPLGFGPANPPAANIERFGDYLNRAVAFPLATERATLRDELHLRSRVVWREAQWLGHRWRLPVAEQDCAWVSEFARRQWRGEFRHCQPLLGCGRDQRGCVGELQAEDLG